MGGSSTSWPDLSFAPVSNICLNSSLIPSLPKISPLPTPRRKSETTLDQADGSAARIRGVPSCVASELRGAGNSETRTQRCQWTEAGTRQGDSARRAPGEVARGRGPARLPAREKPRWTPPAGQGAAGLVDQSARSTRAARPRPRPHTLAPRPAVKANRHSLVAHRLEGRLQLLRG